MKKRLITLCGVLAVGSWSAASADVILAEDFESGIPAGWSAIDDAGNGLTWSTTGSGSCVSGAGGGDAAINYTSGSGDAACASSDAFGESEFDTSLITSTFSLDDFLDASISYNANYQNFGGLDFLDLDITTDGGSTWTNLLSWNEDHGGLFVVGGEDVSIDLAAYLGESSVNIRWHYYDPNSDDFDWYANIDDVLIEGTPAPSTGVPEPMSLALVALGLLGLRAAKRRSV